MERVSQYEAQLSELMDAGGVAGTRVEITPITTEQTDRSEQEFTVYEIKTEQEEQKKVKLSRQRFMKFFVVNFTFPQLNVGPEPALGEDSWDEEDYILEDQQYRDTPLEEEEEQIEVEFPVKLEPKDQRCLEDTKAIKHKTRCKVCHEEFKNKKSEIQSSFLFLQSLVW